MYSLEPHECAELISKSRSVVALTGAGISTSAGIPDFRGPQGLYVTRRYDPERVFHIEWFNSDPSYFYEFSRDFTETVKDIKPTQTHLFLAQLETKGLLESIITQNIDILHQTAGNQNVVELHGSYSSATCQSCKNHLADLNYKWWCERIKSSHCSPVVLCDKCSGFLKPDIVFFGEPVTAFEKAEEIVSDCDLLLVLGSSLNVAPASLLPGYSKATTIIVNKGAVALSASPARHFINDDLDTYFLQVARHMNIFL
jgi:NAD-dependent deacetylase